MDINIFLKKIKEISPSEDDLKREGYKSAIEEILQEFNLVIKEEVEIKGKFTEDFFTVYNLENFRVLNLFFTDELSDDIIEGHVIFGFIDGGYISYEKKTGVFFTSYADDIENTLEILCNSSENFLKILLIVADFSSKGYKGEILNDNEEIKEEYIDKCHDIYPLGMFEPLFN